MVAPPRSRPSPAPRSATARRAPTPAPAPAPDVRPRPRVGHIAFLNCLPLYYGLVHDGALLDMELTRGTPTELNRLLIEGHLDVAPISSVEYLRHAGDLLLLPGPDRLLRRPGAEHRPRRSGAPRRAGRAPRGPHHHLRHLAGPDPDHPGRALRRRPAVRRLPARLERMLTGADAALLIGDPALHVLWRPPPGLHVQDLGAEWHAHTGQAMVFAVWAVRRDYAARAPDLVAEVLDAFRRSLRYSLRETRAIARAAARWESLPADVLEGYFRALRFEFGPRYQAGLTEFARRAVAHGALGRVPPLEFFQP